MNERCGWSGSDPLYIDYHDHEWAVPEYDPGALWEKLILEGFQAGLSWITILRKRDEFRKEFEGFDPDKIAKWDDERILKALQNPGIIRHRGKIEATVKGARLFLEIEAEEGFATWLWSFVSGSPIQNNFKDLGEVPACTPESTAMSKALKKRGFNFCGPVITYAFMQAAGMVNDHVTTCPCHEKVKALSTRG